MRTLATIVFILISQASYADCYGSGTFKNCYDRETGNNYTIQKYGNQTHMEGRNRSTGSRWSQDSTTIGNTTFHNGRAANGNRWNSTETRIGNQTMYSGKDSRGNRFNKTCNGNGYCY